MLTRRLGPAILVLLLRTLAFGADQAAIGAGNDRAFAIASKSPLVNSAMSFLKRQAEQIHDPRLKRETLDAFTNPATCITHRANLTDKDKGAIIQQLIDAGLVAPADAADFPGGLTSAIFPPVKDDGSACPHLPQRFESTPGSVFEGHHSYPGGLAMHEAFNTASAISTAADYQVMYGHLDASGLPSIDPAQDARFSELNSGLPIDRDLIVAAPIWHDWGKVLVFQWNADGSEFQELKFGGNGKTDNAGGKGDSRTPGHHIIGLAESIKRGLSPELVITQASAHKAPTVGEEYQVVNWIRAAAIMARIDPIVRGYLKTDAKGTMRLPAVAATGTFDLEDARTSPAYFLPEYTINNLSDLNYTLALPAAFDLGLILEKLAPEFGINPADRASFNNNFRNPILSYLSAERLIFIYARRGIDGVRGEVKRLRAMNMI